MGCRERPGKLGEGPAPSVEDRRPGFDQLRVPGRQLLGGRAVLANRPQERVSLGQDAAVRGEVRRVRGHALCDERVQRAASQGGRAGDEKHLFRPEHDHPHEPGQPGGAARDPVDPDPLSSPGGTVPEQHDVKLERVEAGQLAARVDPREPGAPADQLAVHLGSVGRAARTDDKGLEQARLAGRVRAPDEVGARPERRRQRRVAAEVGHRDRGAHGDRGGRSSGRRVAVYDVVRTGMTTCV